MNIKPNFIISCDQAFLTSGTNNLNLINIFTTLHSDQFPFTYHRFSLVINFDIDVLGMHPLETRITDENGKELIRSELKINISSSPFQVIANFENFSFPAPGKFEIRVSLQGKLIGSRVLNINSVQKQKTPTA